MNLELIPPDTLGPQLNEKLKQLKNVLAYLKKTRKESTRRTSAGCTKR